jgi:hypothetical protein
MVGDGDNVVKSRGRSSEASSRPSLKRNLMTGMELMMVMMILIKGREN